MIRSPYICRTNLDRFKKAKWPERFVTTPRVGDTVEGRGEGAPCPAKPRLKIVSITHCFRDDDGSPFVEIELHQ